MKHKVLSREEWKAEYQARLHGQRSIENVEAPKPKKNKQKNAKGKEKSKVNTKSKDDPNIDDKK